MDVCASRLGGSREQLRRDLAGNIDAMSEAGHRLMLARAYVLAWARRERRLGPTSWTAPLHESSGAYALGDRVQSDLPGTAGRKSKSIVSDQCIINAS